MPSQVTNYQCPACTGPLHFAGDSGKLECDYCGSAYEVSEIEALYQQKEEQAVKAHEDAQTKGAEDDGWDTSGLSGDWGADAAGMKAYNCPSCGAELICDESTAATSCPYCGNPTVVPGQFGGTLRPDFVLPFKLSKEDAVAALKKHYKGKVFLPKSFTAGNHIQVPVPTAPAIMRSPRQNIMTFSVPVPSRLKRSRWMRPARCRTTTWIPLNPMTIQN